jgi:hypothetical protein
LSKRKQAKKKTSSHFRFLSKPRKIQELKAENNHQEGEDTDAARATRHA